MLFEEAQGHPPQQGKVLRAVFLLDSAGVLREANIQLPMQAVLHVPVTAQLLGILGGTHASTTYEVTRLFCCFAVNRSLAPTHSDRRQFGPVGIFAVNVFEVLK